MTAYIRLMVLGIMSLSLCCGCAALAPLGKLEGELEAPVDGFGLREDMTKDDFPDLVPYGWEEQEALWEEGGVANFPYLVPFDMRGKRFIYLTKAVPDPNPLMPQYLVIICPKHALVSVKGTTERFGDYTKGNYFLSEYNKMKELIQRQHGPGRPRHFTSEKKVNEYAKKGMLLPVMWLVWQRNLGFDEGKLFTLWRGNLSPEYDAIRLRGIADSETTGRLEVAYDFSHYRACVIDDDHY